MQCNNYTIKILYRQECATKKRVRNKIVFNVYATRHDVQTREIFYYKPYIIVMNSDRQYMQQIDEREEPIEPGLYVV